MKVKATVRAFAVSKYIYVLVFVTGAAAFLYPLISNIYNSEIQTRVISLYREEVAAYDEATIEAIKEEAAAYNEFVAGLEGNVADEMTDAEREASTVVYMSILSTGEALGYVTIPRIEVELPIYRGSSEEVLQVGVGHMERSSLPVGGVSTHAVLTAHRGLPTSRLFRDLGFLEVGDIFMVESAGETVTYEVESMISVLPTEVEALRIQEGRDLCTLLTCDPYMINSHRLLVTGHRIESTPELIEQASANQVSFILKYWEYAVIVAFFALIWLVIFLIRRRLRKKKVPQQVKVRYE